MQRIGNLFHQLYGFDNLLQAWQKTKAGSRKTEESASFFFQMEIELLQLRDELQNETWQPQPFHFFELYDPKQRTIAVAAFRDRIVHHALVNVLEPIWERRFISDSYATRKNKGVHAAVAAAQVFLRKNEWFLKSDVEKFFDSVHHDTLLRLIERVVKDQKVISVCEKIIRHGGVAGRGLPIGNRTSQFFANVYLHPFDLFLKQECRVKGYVRYMDDFVLFHHDKAVLKSLRHSAEAYLFSQLHLRLKPESTFLNSRQNGLGFLGKRIFPSLIRLRNQNLRRITRRIAVREKWYAEGKLTEEEFLHSMNSYWAMLQYYPLEGLRKKLSGYSKWEY